MYRVRVQIGKTVRWAHRIYRDPKNAHRMAVLLGDGKEQAHLFGFWVLADEAARLLRRDLTSRAQVTIEKDEPA